MDVSEITEVEPADSRREALLEAAVAVFARYGFRKTSMDEVSRAAGVSRQGLYLHFADKEALFKEALAFKFTRQLGAAQLALTDPQRDLESRLIAACDEWAGRFIGTMGADAADLMCASVSLAGATLAHYEAQFERAVAHAIAGSALAGFCSNAACAPADVARALHATVRGLKHSSKTRQEFVRAMTVAVRMFCAPLHGRGSRQELALHA